MIYLNCFVIWDVSLLFWINYNLIVLIYIKQTGTKKMPIKANRVILIFFECNEEGNAE